MKYECTIFYDPNPQLTPELSRADTGTETFARTLTAYNKDLYNCGLLAEPIVVTRAKLESQIKVHGKRRVDDLSKRRISGTYLSIIYRQS